MMETNNRFKGMCSNEPFKIIVEDSSLVDMPIFVISNNLIDVTLYGDKESAVGFVDFLNGLFGQLSSQSIVIKGYQDRIDNLFDESKQLKNDCSILVLSNQEYRNENKELRIIINTLKEQNQKFKARLNELGVEYYD